MTLDTRTPAEIAYDATSLYLKPVEDDDALTPDEETVLDILLAHQRRADEDTRQRQWREQARITGSQELRSLLDFIDAHFDAEERARFTAGYQDGQAIARAITDDPTNDGSPWGPIIDLITDTPISPVEQQVIDILLKRQPADENAVAAWIDAQRPAVLDWETARQRALAEWKGEIRTRDDGRTHRYPMLEEVEIAQLADGTPVYGDFDNDDTPHVVWVEWGGFSICAGVDGFDMGDQKGNKEYHHSTPAQWESLKKLVTSGVIDQALNYAKAWEAQREEDTDSIIKVLELMDGGE